MKKNIRVLLLLPFIGCFLLQPSLARQLAAADFGQESVRSERHQPVKSSLKNILQRIEQRFDVSVAYKSGIVENKSLSLDVSSYSSVEEALQKALSPFGLGYERIRAHFYFVSRVQQNVESSSLQHGQKNMDHTVQGKVSDEEGDPLPGVTVKLQGTNIGTATNADGAFSLVVPEQSGEKLEISFIGYETLEVPVNDRVAFSIVLKKATNTLNEIVVTGYTSQRKKDLTGAVDVVNVDNMISQPVPTVTSLLQGQASGVTVLGSGQPGSEPMIHIRGVNTFGDNTPLYVVDGVPTQDISDLNPNDIASLQVLKDAGAASIYGSRASNGVIIITTKKGSGKIKVEYDAYYGRQYPQGGNVWHTLTPQEMADLRWIALKNSGTTNISDPLYGNGAKPVLPDYLQPAGVKEGDPSANPDNYFIDPDYTSEDEYYDFYRIVKANKQGTDWYHELFKPAPVTSHNLTVNGGGDKGNYLFSLNYFNQRGTLMNTYLKRYTLRSNTKYNITKNIRIGENLSYSVTDNPGVDVLSADAPIGMAIREQPVIPVHDIMGNFAGGYGSGLGDAANPVATMYRSRNNRGQGNRLFGNIYADADFLKYFTVRTSFGGEIYSGWDHSFSYPEYENKENSTSNSYDESSSSGHNWTWTNTLAFHKDFSDLHDLKVLIGSEAYKEKGRSVGGSTTDYFSFDPDYVGLSTGSGTQNNNSDSYMSTLYSLFGRIDYAYNDKYLLSVTLRRDGSSVFLNNRYGLFPAVSAAWRISQEAFMKNISWISDLKIRGGWGIMGNQFNVSAKNAYTLYNSNRSTSYYDITGSNSGTIMGFQQERIGNPDAKWESDVNANIGLDATLFNDHLEMTIDYYRKDIRDLLYDPELPGLSGVAGAPDINIGNIKNEGIDISLSGHTNISQKLKLDATLTFTTYKNEIIKIANDVDYFDRDDRRFQGSTVVRNAVGHPVSSFFGYQITGFWDDAAEIEQANAEAQKATDDPAAEYQTDAGVGRFRYADADGNGQITPDDRVFLGNPNPKFSYGLNLGLTYENFDFSIFLYGVHGNQIWNNVKWWTDFYASFGGAKSNTALYDSWTPDHKNAKAPIQENTGSFSTQGVPNSYFVENGAYLRAKNLQFGFTFPKPVLSRIGVNKLRVYVQAANLFTLTKYSGIDPEVSGDEVTDFGIDDGAYPNQREFLVGVNLSF